MLLARGCLTCRMFVPDRRAEIRRGISGVTLASYVCSQKIAKQAEGSVCLDTGFEV